MDETDDRLGGEATASFTISQRKVTLVGLSVSDKVYDGETDATVTGTPGLDDKLAGDDVSVVSNDNPATFEDANVREGKTVYLDGYSLTGEDANNYRLTHRDLVADITPREVGLRWSDTTEFTYDGNEHVPTVELTGVLEGDTCEVTVTGAQIDAGEYTATATALSNPNYKLPEDATQAFTIRKAAPEVTSPTAVTGLVFNGSAQQLVNAGEVTGGTMQYSLDGEHWSADLPTGTDAGEYGIYYRVVGDANHSDVEPQGPISVCIAKARALPQVMITHYVIVGTTDVSVSLPDVMPGDAGALTYTAGEPRTTPNVSVSGFAVNAVNQEAAVTATLPGGTDRDSVILPVNIQSLNYEDSEVQVMVVLTHKEDAQARITFEDSLVESLTRTYGDPDFTLTPTVQNAGDGAGSWIWASSNENVAVVDDGVVTLLSTGVTVLTASYTSDTTTGQATVKLKVNPKELGLIWTQTTFTYDGTPHAPAATADGLVNGDAVDVTVEGAQTDAGEYTATAVGLTGEQATNYALPGDARREGDV